MSHPHRYRIQTVSELTGVATSTLRAWERRYGVPQPARAESSYRMYGELDVALIRRMRSLIESGVTASEAARLARRPQEELKGHVEEDRFTPVAERLVELTRQMDATELPRAVRGALALGDAYAVVRHVFMPALQEVGEQWRARQLTIAHEHFASEIIGGVVRDLLRHVQPAFPRARAVLGCFADEMHTLPLYGAAFTFTQRGVATQMLGARTDPQALGEAVQLLMPQLIGLSVTLPPARSKLGALLDGYAKAAGAVPWIVGGSGSTEIADEVVARGGLVVRPEPDGLRALIDALLLEVRRVVERR